MIWQHPWALLGIAGVALPILIHLLGRGHARVIRFPSLRFIDASRLLPTKRSRIQDPLLLAVRIAIVGTAALALAQPLVLSRGRRQTLDRGVARAIIVDASESMRRASRDSTRAIARQLATDAQSSIVVESSDPRRALVGAVAWIAKQQRRGEIAIVSDFQRGQLAREDLNGVPATVGIVPRRVPVAASGDSALVRTIAAGHTRTAVARSTATGVDVQWRMAGDSADIAPIALFAGRDDAPAIAAEQTAVASLPLALPIDTSRAMAIVFARHAARDSLIKSLVPARVPWKLSLLADARRAGFDISAAGDATIEDRRRFVVATNTDPASLDAARLVALARRWTSAAAPAGELEPAVVSDSELATWTRAAAPAPAATQYRATDENGPSDGRWLWGAALLLMLVEWQLRRQVTARAATATVERARAA